jgi:pyruvate-ferredoxin/flavodoxin oxidoreductase
MDTGWIMLHGKDAQQASDQAIILRKVTELALNPGINIQDGFLTTHLERTFHKPEPALIREFLGRPDDMIDSPTEAQRTLFGPKRRRVPEGIDLKNPILLGPVQNQEHHMNGVAARRNNFSEHILGFLEDAYTEFGKLTGRNYGLISEYNCENADTVFVAIGCAAENIEASIDHLKKTRNVNVGVIHINVIRPFPENAIINALRGKKNVIVLERTDESLAGDNPLTRDIRVALSKALDNNKTNAHAHLEKMSPDQKPEIFSGVYGMGSRDFRPEGIIGAYEFVTGQIARYDGKKASDGTRFFYVGIEHPYAVISKDAPSGLPEGSIAVRLHSIGGWGMITTGKNLGEIIGEFSNYIATKKGLFEPNGEPKEIIKISANPKYGSEKKGAPTNYFLVAAPERIRVNCDLRHVNVVLCCDPKIFLHTNPLIGLTERGAFVWESSADTAEEAWQRIPKKYRQEIIDKKIQVYTLNGFKIAREATSRADLQTRMQGNAFLGAFFSVSPFLKDNQIPKDEFYATVRDQYKKKFGRFGEAVIESNMKVMEQGFETLKLVEYGDVNAPDRSTFSSGVLQPCNTCDAGSCSEKENRTGLNKHEIPMCKMSTFDAEFRAGLGYNQPSSPLASVGLVASGTGSTVSKYVARREVPVWHPEKCIQCMECTMVCPDTALPNTAQEISTILNTAIKHYVSNAEMRTKLLDKVEEISQKAREKMLAVAAEKGETSFPAVIDSVLADIRGNEACSEECTATVKELMGILNKFPVAFHKTATIFANMEKKTPGQGGVFSICVSDLCKGCGACARACGNRGALTMEPETEEIHGDLLSAASFLGLLQDTPQKYLGLYNAENPQESKAAVLRNHLMQRSKYTALIAGDGSCAGCGEKSVLRSVSTLTEAIMRPIYHRKADRLYEKALQLKEVGVKALGELKAKNPEAYNTYVHTVAHTIMGFGGTDKADTEERMKNEFKGNDQELIDAMVTVLMTESYNHKDLQTIEGTLPNGMCAMAMTANTGCNSVYGSTPPNNPHPYPWMNSLFQDGPTIGWLVAESFIQNHTRRSIIPERLADYAINNFAKTVSEDDYFRFTHFTDAYMTDQEIMEIPKVWAIGGDGGMGDIGFQNLSKVIVQNRPNINVMMLNTQVYSNTGGQNSDLSVMPGGFDMNQFGEATEGKLTEMKSPAEAFTAGHGSAYIAQVSLANAANLYKSVVDGICYRGTSYIQAYTPCQPEHGIADDSSPVQAGLARDSRGIPEFVFDPSLGESYTETLSLKANSNTDKDWAQKTIPGTKDKYDFTVAHWAATEPRFRFHLKKAKDDQIDSLPRLENLIKLITMDDIVKRHYLNPEHRAYIPGFGTYFTTYGEDGKPVHYLASRQMVIFCVERRKAWRMLQSRANIQNTDYAEQKALLAKVDSGELTREAVLKS